MPTFPFEVTLEEIIRDPENYVDSVFSCLESEFLVMPKGAGFVEYPVFERGYEALKAATDGFSMVDPDEVYPVTASEPISIVVLRTMLGFTPPEVTRIQHLGELSLAGRSGDNPKYEVIACIGGRGFGVRREDMKKMILATRGKVFTAKTLDRLVECTRLSEYKTNQ